MKQTSKEKSELIEQGITEFWRRLCLFPFEERISVGLAIAQNVANEYQISIRSIVGICDDFFGRDVYNYYVKGKKQ